MTESHLAWTLPDRSAAVLVSDDVVARLNAEVMRGYGVTRRRGTELGGVLLGRVMDGKIVIEDFASVPCEYAFGPSYILSPADKVRFAETVEKTAPIGFFRSHTREGLMIDDADAAMAEKIPGFKVALLIKPYATRTPAAGFFLADDGRLRAGTTGQEFPFAASQIVEAGAAPVAPLAAPPVETVIAREPESAIELAPEPALTPAPQDLPAEPVAAVPLEKPQEPPYLRTPFDNWKAPPPKPRLRPWFVAAAFTVAATGLGAVAGYQLAGGQTAPVFARRASAAAAAPDPWTLRLRATLSGEAVAVEWDRESTAVLRAGAGVLAVTEGGRTNEVRLGIGELRKGVVLYGTTASAARFRLDVYVGPNRYTGETVDWSR